MPRLLLCLVLLAACRERPLHAVRSIDELQREQAARDGRSDARGALELAEAIKCRRVRARLLAVGATPHALPELERAPLPALAADEAVLSLYETRGKLARYLARGRRVEALRPVELARLVPSVIAARDELELGALDGKRLDELLSRLRGLLLEGTALRDVRRLLVLPDGIARFVPVHALVRSTPAGPRYLAQLHDIAYAPCLGLVRPADRLTQGGTVVAPDYAPRARGERHLEGARLEAARVAAQLSTRALLGEQATPERLQAALAEQHIIHFAGHGLVDLASGSPPQLLFPDGQPPVTLRGATARPSSAGLVVLASCTAAYAARFRDGKRLLAETTFVEGLLAAGARRVVAASWAVKDQQSAEQMAIFHARLRVAGAAGALAAAQRDAIARIVPPHPRFWAFYATYGGW